MSIKRCSIHPWTAEFVCVQCKVLFRDDPGRCPVCGPEGVRAAVAREKATRAWSDLCDKMAKDIVSDNSWPGEWTGPPGEPNLEDAAWDLSRCLEKYLARYKKEIAETPNG